jgi:hypothetical protein
VSRQLPIADCRLPIVLSTVDCGLPSYCQLADQSPIGDKSTIGSPQWTAAIGNRQSAIGN